MKKIIDNLPMITKDVAALIVQDILGIHLNMKLKEYLGDVDKINFYAVTFIDENTKETHWYGDNAVDFIQKVKQLDCPTLFATYSENQEGIVDFEDFKPFDIKNVEKANAVWIADIGSKNQIICALPNFALLWYLFES